MSVIDELITDRTIADVRRVAELAAKGYSAMTAEEKAEWQTDMKGAYNVSDLNRVTEAVLFVADRLEEAGYDVPPLTTRTWAEPDVPTVEELAHYLHNVQVIRAIIASDAPEAPTDMSGLTHEEANNIEQILVSVWESIVLIIDGYFYANEIQNAEGWLSG